MHYNFIADNYLLITQTIVVLLSVVSIFTICGNLFVILSVLLKDQLRRVRSNMFIISLGKSNLGWYLQIIWDYYLFLLLCPINNIRIVIRFSAFTDLLVGVICMPFIVSKLANREDGEWANLKWPHNEGSCMIWLFSDLVACTASIWNLVIIAFDRFLVSYISFAVACLSILNLILAWYQ